jgi:eukaryotic-like serine/threonine-protein kinase
MTGGKTCPVCGGAYTADDLFCPRDRAPLVPAGDGTSLEGYIVADRYLLSGLIGAGGMGEVYRAQDVRLQRPAAVKLLRAALTADIDALRRFRREGLNASRINHPHVVQVYDAGETASGVPYLAMEFVAGKSLGRVLADEGPLAPSRAAELMRQIAGGLDAAHRLGVVHRDLKPDNILVANVGTPEETAKVVDFGISRALRDDSQKVTKSGYVAGTYEFMSPEQVLGGEFDHRSDLYALALIAFMLLTGRLPFPGDTAEHSMLMRLNEPPRSLHAMSPERDWPSALQEVFDRALSREPGERFGSAGEFAAAIGDAVLRRPPTTPSVAGAVPRRRLAWAAGAAATACIIVAIVAGTTYRWASSRDESQVADVGDTSVAQPQAELDSSANVAGTRPVDTLQITSARPDSGTPRADGGTAPVATDSVRDTPRADTAARRASSDTSKTVPSIPAPDTGRLAQVAPGPAVGRKHPIEANKTARNGVESRRGVTSDRDRMTTGGQEDGGHDSGSVHEPGPQAPSIAETRARALLDPFDFILRAGLPADSARLALETLDGILPRLSRARDSVDADLYRAEALTILGMEQRACSTLDAAWSRANELQRKKIRTWIDRGICPGAGWIPA